MSLLITPNFTHVLGTHAPASNKVIEWEDSMSTGIVLAPLHRVKLGFDMFM
jgi:hypothetical protein